MMDLRQRHILVRDPAASVADLIREALEEDGYKVSVLSERSLAATNMARGDVDLVIVDPAADGADPREWLQQWGDQAFPDRDIPLVVCSGHTRALHDLAEVFAVRGIGVLPKPFDLQDLLHVVATTIGSPTAHEDGQPSLDDASLAPGQRLTSVIGVFGAMLAVA